MRVALVLILWLVFAVATALIARSKGRNPLLWGVMGVLLGLIGLIIVAVLPSRHRPTPTTAAQP